MARTIADRTKETSTTTGTGTLDLDGAKTGFQTFVAAVSGGAEVYYTIVAVDGNGAPTGEWETGIGTVTSGSPDTLSRDTVISSSNAGSLVSFSAGTKDVFISVPHTGGPLVLHRASPSAVAQVDFDLPTDFFSLQIQGWLKPATDGVNLLARLSNDGGSTFRSGASDYEWVDARWDSAAGSLTGDAADSEINLGTNTGNAAGEQISIHTVIQGANTASARTSLITRYMRRNSAGGMFTGSPTGELLTEEVNDAIRIFFSSGNIADGSLTLVGVP